MSVEGLFRVCFGGPPYRHQREVAEVLLEGGSVVVRAPCGSGKTEAAVFPYLLGMGSTLPRRLIYSLPTRALVEDIAKRINEKLLKLDLEHIEVSCQHGANSEDPFFKKDIIVTTIDQTIGAYCSTPLSLPIRYGNIPAGAAVSSLLCFDEVHTYDHDLGLKTMLVLVERARKLGLPFVVMSATLPDSFLEWFAERDVEVVEATDKDVPSRKKRRVELYWVEKQLNPEEVSEFLGSRRKVIVVCNTVARAQQIYSWLKKEGKEGLYLLHSRFVPDDRKKREKEMLKAFKSEGSACLVTTQVCEVGLDISCDVMLTEVAPPDALVQRMGRCAREGDKGKVFVYEAEISAPYSEELVRQSKKYLKRELDGGIIRWKEEIEFVNHLLDDRFKCIVRDEAARRRILNNLGSASFKGDRKSIEENVRRILSVNVTIYDEIDRLSDVIWKMPWIKVDVRVLRRAMEKYGLNISEVVYGRDENKRPLFKVYPIRSLSELIPYGYYVIHPEGVRYDPFIGLVFGEEGWNLEPTSKDRPDPREPPEYHRELWLDHSLKCLKAFDEIKEQELPLRFISRLIGQEPEFCEGVLALAVALHDLGKLNKDWQRAVGVKNEAERPLAHSLSIRGKRPNHATISGHASTPLFESLLGRRRLYKPIIIAINHHHYTRSEKVSRYEIGWRATISELFDEMMLRYNLDLDLDRIKWSSAPTRNERFPVWERINSYTIYAVVSRLIRLCDRYSFEMQ